jgi:hypothetical protein
MVTLSQVMRHHFAYFFFEFCSLKNEKKGRDIYSSTWASKMGKVSSIWAGERWEGFWYMGWWKVGGSLVPGLVKGGRVSSTWAGEMCEGL